MLKKNLFWLCLLVAGCGQFPNPNDLVTSEPSRRAAIVYERLESAETILDDKVGKGEIVDSKRNEMIRELSEELLKSVEPESVPDEDQWKYATLLRITDRWADAEAALKVAVKVADTPDRKVNDTLKLAQAEAKNNEVAEAIKTASLVLGVPDKDAAPILPSVLYEIVPAAEKKGHDKDLAQLLSAAIECHMRVKVDRDSDAGRQFLIARRYHVNKAQRKVEELLSSTT